MIHHQKPECPVGVERGRCGGGGEGYCIAVFKVDVKGKEQNVRDCLFWTAKHFVTKLGMMIHHDGVDCHVENFVCCLQGHGHSKSSYDQIWLFLLHLLNCWSFRNQTWFILLEVGVSCGNKMNCCVEGQGHSETSKCQWTFVWTISSELLNSLSPSLVWWSLWARVSCEKVCLLSSRLR